MTLTNFSRTTTQIELTNMSIFNTTKQQISWVGSKELWQNKLCAKKTWFTIYISDRNEKQLYIQYMLAKVMSNTFCEKNENQQFHSIYY